MASFGRLLRLSTYRILNCRCASRKSDAIKMVLFGGIGQPSSSRLLLVPINSACFVHNDNVGAPPNNKKKPETKVKDAVQDVAKHLHPHDDDNRQRVRIDLTTKLTAIEKETYRTGTAAAIGEQIADTDFTSFVTEMRIAKSDKPQQRHSVTERDRRRGGLLRREAFHHAMAMGYSAEDAQKLTDQIETKYRERLMHAETDQPKHDGDDGDAAVQIESDKFIKDRDHLFQQALLRADRALTSMSGVVTRGSVEQLRDRIEPSDAFADNIFDGQPLNIFDESKSMHTHSLPLWSQLDADITRIVNQSTGPRNAFEEQIEWTENGKMWPYPIDNEYMLGEEAEVSFVEHVFLERHLQRFDLPKTGPVAHFMELVCVGMSKNPYMTAKQKVDHLEWFAQYFNHERLVTIERLQQQQQQMSIVQSIPPSSTIE